MDTILQKLLLVASVNVALCVHIQAVQAVISAAVGHCLVKVIQCKTGCIGTVVGIFA